MRLAQANIEPLQVTAPASSKLTSRPQRSRSPVEHNLDRDNMVVDETYLCMTDVDALVDDIFNLDEDDADDTLSDPHYLPDSCWEL
eukprot:2471298-Karenia_brevis.AAC.1